MCHSMQSWCLPFTIATSQTPTKLTEYYRFERAGEGGGFGTVIDQGYGISYIVVGEDKGRLFRCMYALISLSLLLYSSIYS